VFGGRALWSCRPPFRRSGPGGSPFDAGDRHQQVALEGEPGDPPLDLSREAVDGFVEEVDTGDLPDPFAAKMT
jgi:hypothetical protein